MLGAIFRLGWEERERWKNSKELFLRREIDEGKIRLELGQYFNRDQQYPGLLIVTVSVVSALLTVDPTVTHQHPFTYVNIKVQEKPKVKGYLL